eukprot:262540_1
MTDLAQLQKQVEEFKEQQKHQLELMQKQMRELQRKNQKYEYKGPELKIKLQISNTIFVSSTNTLCNKQNGSNIFIQKILGVDEHDDQKNNEGDDNKSEYLNAKLIESQKKGTQLELFFDRDPELFPIILKYLRGYIMQPLLNECSVVQLQSLLDDAHYYRINGLIDIISNCIYNRFDPSLCAPSITLSDNGIGITRNAVATNLHHSCGVYGILRRGKRYVEFQLMSQGNRYIMFGVTEAEGYMYAPYPGHAKCKGCSVYGANGNLYRAGSIEGWAPALGWSDRIGILVDISNDLSTATIAWYVNGKLVKQAKNLKDYMDVSKGVIFVANLYAHNDQVVIMQNCKMPQ